MKKSHIFRNLTLTFAISAMCIAHTGMAQSSDGVETLDLFPEASPTMDVDVSGTFSMEIKWHGEDMRIESILWDNNNASNGSAFLRIFNSDEVLMWSGYPLELSNFDHSFTISDVVFETDMTYVLEFDITQSKVSVFTNELFPWRPDNDGPIEIVTSELTGAVDQPIDPDKIFPYFSMNLVYGVGIDEDSIDDWSPSPNPAQSFINLPELTQPAVINVVNLSGQKVWSSTAEAGQSQLDISELSTGMYIFQIVQNDQLISNDLITVE